MTLPSELETFILEELGLSGFTQQHAVDCNDRTNHLREQMHRLSEEFAARAYSESDYADAYFAYNFPINAIKTILVINDLRTTIPGIFSTDEKVSVLDVGCGDGAALVGCYYALHKTQGLLLTGIDVSATMLRRCQAVTTWLEIRDPRVIVKLKTEGLSHRFFRKTHHRFDMIIFAHSLTEIHTGDTVLLRYIEQVLRCLKEKGILVIIEPALKANARRLMQLRNELVLQNTYEVLLPCLHREQCPLLGARGEKEWCHQSVAWQPPEYLVLLNKGLDREITRLKYSYLVIGGKSNHRITERGYRVVSHRLVEKGRQRCYLCTQYGRVELVRQDKSKSSTNALFEEVQMGDIIDVKDYILMKQHYWEVGTTTHVKILKRRNPE